MTLTRTPPSQLTSESTYEYSRAAHCAPVRSPFECFPIWASRTYKRQNGASLGGAGRGGVFLSYNCGLCGRCCWADLFISFPGVSQISPRKAGCARSPADRLARCRRPRPSLHGEQHYSRTWGGGEENRRRDRRRGRSLCSSAPLSTPGPRFMIDVNVPEKQKEEA